MAERRPVKPGDLIGYATAAGQEARWKLAPETLRRAGVELGRDYPQPLVRHEEAREQTLQRYAVVKKPVA